MNLGVMAFLTSNSGFTSKATFVIKIMYAFPDTFHKRPVVCINIFSQVFKMQLQILFFQYKYISEKLHLLQLLPFDKFSAHSHISCNYALKEHICKEKIIKLLIIIIIIIILGEATLG